MSKENKTFSYYYSGAINNELEQMKEKYAFREADEKMKKIRNMDNNVDLISAMISVFIGLSGSCLLATGIIWIIKELYSIPIGIITSVIGIIIVASVPFIHTKIYNSIKAHYAPKIIELIKEIEQNQL